LDQYPTTRWDLPTRYFAHQINVVQAAILPRIPGYLKNIFWILSLIMESQSQRASSLNELTNERYLELKGIAEVLDVPVYEIMLCNFEYELFAYCTSIIAHDRNGEIVHGRNFDYPIYKYMKDLTFTADFYVNGKMLFRADMFAGYAGVCTGMKPGKFAISINERHINSTFGLFRNLYRWTFGTYSPATLLKHTFEVAESYEEAKDMLTNTPLTAPVYIIISGVNPDEGAIITRDRSGAADVWLINHNSPTDWAIYQTNHDHWIRPAPYSDKNRAETTKIVLSRIGNGQLTNEDMVMILQKPPIFNKGTLYSTVMRAKDDYMKIYRYI
jgi:hypothetical protein